MSRPLFNVTYDIVTPESAENGDTDENGFICEGETLREALKELYRTRTCHVDSGQGLDTSAEWLTYSNGMEYETGAYETRYLHMPDTVTPSSWLRIVRLAESRHW